MKLSQIFKGLIIATFFFTILPSTNVNAALTNDDLAVLNNAPNGIGISNYMSNAKPMSTIQKIFTILTLPKSLTIPVVIPLMGTLLLWQVVKTLTARCGRR
jgi:hypothetical protein